MKNRKRREPSRRPSYKVFFPYANTLNYAKHLDSLL